MTGSTKRLGTRYGITIRNKLDAVETTQMAFYECPKCMQKKVKRVSAGIWECKKCGTKFAGRAYTVSKKIKIKDEVVEATGEGKEMKRRRIKRVEKDNVEEQEGE